MGVSCYSTMVTVISGPACPGVRFSTLVRGTEGGRAVDFLSLGECCGEKSGKGIESSA